MSQQVAPQESNQPASESGESKDVHSYFYIPLMIVGGLIGAACCVGLYFAIGNALPWLRKIPIIILIFPALVIIGLLSAADAAIAKRSPSLMRAKDRQRLAQEQAAQAAQAAAGQGYGQPFPQAPMPQAVAPQAQAGQPQAPAMQAPVPYGQPIPGPQQPQPAAQLPQYGQFSQYGQAPQGYGQAQPGTPTQR